MTRFFFAPEEFVSDRVLLRCYRPGDGRDLNVATLESYEHLAPWMPWATEDQTTEESEKLVRTFCAQYLLSNDFVIAVRTPDDETYLGGSGFHLREGGLEMQSAEIGMWIRASAAGQGIGTATLTAMLDWGFEEWPWRRLAWRCDAENGASRHIAEKCGLTEEGTLRRHTKTPQGEWRDTVCFAMLRDEWRERQGE